MNKFKCLNLARCHSPKQNIDFQKCGLKLFQVLHFSLDLFSPEGLLLTTGKKLEGKFFTKTVDLVT